MIIDPPPRHDAGWRDFELLHEHPDLAALRSQPEFEALGEKAEKQWCAVREAVVNAVTAGTLCLTIHLRR